MGDAPAKAQQFIRELVARGWEMDPALETPEPNRRPLAPVADVVLITDRINHLRALAAENGEL